MTASGFNDPPFSSSSSSTYDHCLGYIDVKGFSCNTYTLINFIICVLQGTSNNNAAFNA